MVLTQGFKETTRAQVFPVVWKLGRSILRDFINPTVGFPKTERNNNPLGCKESDADARNARQFSGTQFV